MSELKERCAEQKSAPQECDIRWVVTVPAIWKQPARQLMREAAYEVKAFFLFKVRYTINIMIRVVIQKLICIL